MIVRNISEVSKQTINSGLTPPAQNPRKVRQNNVPVFSEDKFLANLSRNNLLSLPEKAITELLYTYGLRISEAINILPTDVTPAGQIMVRTKKTGQPRIIVPVIFSYFWTQTGRMALPVSQVYSRFYFYRLFLKLGWYQKYGNNQKRSVTHYFRHELVRNLEINGFSRESIALFLAHRGLQSLQYYER